MAQDTREGTFCPSDRTGINDITAEQRGRILQYAVALFGAKAAGVAGDPVRHPQAFLDRITKERVADADDPIAWAGRVREMDADEATWKLRAADHQARAIARAIPPGGGASEACRIVRRAGRLSDDQRGLLQDEWSRAIVEDRDRVAELIPGIVQPDMGSLRWRAQPIVRSLPAYDRLEQILVGQPYEIVDAAWAAFAKESLPAPLYAILAGPWALAVEGDESVLADAWTEEADLLRADFATIDPRAWQARQPYEADF